MSAVRPSAVTVLALGLLARTAGAQTPVTVNVDAAAQRRPISPLVYGVNHATQAQLLELRAPLNRNGGNTATRYNWQQNAANHASDWYFESLEHGPDVAGEEADAFVLATRAAGAQPMITIPTLGWVAKMGPGRERLASFSIAKYGPQTGSDWQWFPDAGNGILAADLSRIANDPDDANTPADVPFQQGWVEHLVSRWGDAAAGGVRYYILDNEPSIWHQTHRDVHPVGATMDELRDKMLAYADMIKAADPGALVLGPEEYGWTGYFWSGLDQQYFEENGWVPPFPDREAHGDQDYLPWLLDAIRDADVAAGRRRLDVFTVHYYPQSGEFSDTVTAGMQALRNRSTRSLWDPAYQDESWIGDDGSVVQLVPRLRSWVAAGYPGTKTGITEYSWGADGHINGATAQADLLGIFGREGLDLATRWVVPATGTPTYNAFRMYRNYDGAGAAFGDVSVSAAVPDPDVLSAFAAERSSDGALTIMVVHKALAGSPSAALTLNVANFAAAGPAEVWQLTAANTIGRLADAPVTAGTLQATLPAQSITLFVLPAAAGLPAISIGDVTVTEGVSWAARFAVTLSQPSTQWVTVSYQTVDGTAQAGRDYVAKRGLVRFPPGVTTRYVRVAVWRNRAVEPAETFTVQLVTATHATIDDGVGVAAILDAP